MMMRAGEDDDDIQASLLCLIPWHPSGRKVERYVAAACTMMDRRRNTPPLLVPLCICICICVFCISCFYCHSAGAPGWFSYVPFFTSQFYSCIHHLHAEETRKLA